MPAPGDLLAGKYRIERVLAEGGMGVLFEATHLQLEELVAIKFLREELVFDREEASAVQRFLREARALIKIRSEHVVRVLDVAETAAGVPYMVMELLAGQDLDQIVQQTGPLDPTNAVDYVLQACEALAEAHQRGIVHRDLKPANLFVARRADGSPCIKVLDFGISKVSAADGADLGITNTQVVMGSPRYMSPEQLRASKGVDARSDIWAMGIVLYELLTGAPPFDGETMTAVCIAIITDEPKSILAARPDVPRGLEKVVFRALEKDASDRFASIAELAEGLHPFASAIGKASVARVTGTLRRSTGPAIPVDELLPTVVAPAAVAAAPEPVLMRTSTTWGDVLPKPKPRSNKGTVAMALIALLLIASGVAFYARTRAERRDVAMPTGLVAIDPPQPTPARSIAPAAVSAVPEAPSATAPPPENVAVTTSKPPARSVPPKVAPRPAAPTTSVPTASAPDLWNGRK